MKLVYNLPHWSIYIECDCLLLVYIDYQRQFCLMYCEINSNIYTSFNTKVAALFTFNNNYTIEQSMVCNQWYLCIYVSSLCGQVLIIFYFFLYFRIHEIYLQASEVKLRINSGSIIVLHLSVDQLLFVFCCKQCNNYRMLPRVRTPSISVGYTV